MSKRKSIKSMTAYGRATLDHVVGHFTAEVQSVNRRYLECTISLPRELKRFESDIKKWVSTVIARGQISIKVNAEFFDSMPVDAKPNLPLARQLKAAWEKIAHELKLPKDSFKLDMLANIEDIILFDNNLQEEEAFKEILHNVINMALNRLVEMKEVEGKVLELEIVQRLSKISESLKKINLKAPQATKKFRQKLIERLEEVLSGSVENEERILREVGVFAEKIDIAEEILRLESHIKQFKGLLDEPIGSVGKTFDFLLQEMSREANTIGSKSAELEVSQLVIDMKSELERIREQVQNIE